MCADRPAGILWDLDGTIVDTEPVWMEVQFEVVEAYGGQWSVEQAHATTGTNNVYSAQQLINACPEQGLTAEALVSEVVARVVAKLGERPVPWQPGARELVQAFVDAGIPQAIVTASPPEFVAPIIEHLPGMFDAVVTGTDVVEGKPHPEAYLLGASRLGVAASDCVAFEDSVPGSTSARDAGCLVLTVPSPTTHSAPAGHVQLDGLAGLSLDDVVQIWRNHGRDG